MTADERAYEASKQPTLQEAWEDFLRWDIEYWQRLERVIDPEEEDEEAADPERRANEILKDRREASLDFLERAIKEAGFTGTARYQQRMDEVLADMLHFCCDVKIDDECKETADGIMRRLGDALMENRAGAVLPFPADDTGRQAALRRLRWAAKWELPSVNELLADLGAGEELRARMAKFLSAPDENADDTGEA